MVDLGRWTRCRMALRPAELSSYWDTCIEWYMTHGIGERSDRGAASQLNYVCRSYGCRSYGRRSKMLL